MDSKRRRSPAAESMRSRRLEEIADRFIEERGALVAAARTDDGARSRLRDHLLEAVMRRLRLSRREAEPIVDSLLRDLAGFGPLEPLLADDHVTEIMVNGPQDVYVETEGRLERTEVQFEGEDHLLAVIRQMIRPLGRRLDRASPTVDGRLPDGSRLHAMIPPLVLQGPVLTIRKFSRQPLQIDDLVEQAALDKASAEMLVRSVRRRLNILIAGGTSAGKTTVLGALLNRGTSRRERLITIEEAAELRIDRPHLLTLEVQPANTDGKGAVSMRELLRNALRMRPDRLIIGEVRGGEAFELLQALNTGHEGSLSTIHANGTSDALHRFENMALMAEEDLPHPVIRDQVAAAVDLILHLIRMPDGRRRLNHLATVVRSGPGKGWELRTIVRHTDGQFDHRLDRLPDALRERLHDPSDGGDQP